ncbi:synaptotagmin-C-like [Clytia hemisphaerica]
MLGFIVFYMFKKVMAKRAQYLRDLARHDGTKHGESAIFEEQSAILEEKDDEKIDQDDMKVDVTQYFEYQKYDPENLWEQYKKKPSRFLNVAALCESDSDDTTPRIEIQIYYQTFVHLFRVHILSLTKMLSFQTNDSKNIKLKIMLRRSSKTCFSDVTDIYPFGETIEFSDKFSFAIKFKELQEYIIYISVWNVNIFHHEILLGAAHMDLSNYSDFTNKNIISSDIVPVKKDKNIYGHILVGLCYLPSVERLMCVVMSAKDLRDDVTNLSILNNVINPFVDVFLVNDGKMIKCHSTKILLDDKSPVFNEAIEFYIPNHQIEGSDIHLIAMHKYNRITNTLIGKVMIGSHSDGHYKTHWTETLANPEKVIPFWHPLTR